jgi:HD-GYP domain-containing protein (c-di-GMP phosphodiesterase class II)
MGFREISVQDLKVGMYIQLNVSWWKHPFATNSFRIKSAKDIQILRQHGLNSLRYDPGKSHVVEAGSGDTAATATGPSAMPPAGPAVRSAGEEAETLPGEEVDPYIEALRLEKERQTARLKEQWENLSQWGEAYRNTSVQVGQIMKTLEFSVGSGLDAARRLVESLVNTLMRDLDTMVHLVGIKEFDTSSYFHPLNVCILSLVLGRSFGLSRIELFELGLAALLHDIGMFKIPKKIWMNTAPLSPAEKRFLEQHPRYGVSMLTGAEGISARGLDGILHHHEKSNGTGYPQRLQGDQISRFGSIIAIVNSYDGLCNRATFGRLLNPHECLSVMFSRFRPEFSGQLLTAFIKVLGVYPPGTLVELSTGEIGMVMSTNHRNGSQPMVMLYDPATPRQEPMILDLAGASEVEIARSLHASEVSPSVLAYLQPEKMFGFFLGSINSPV